jgi:hypothetical protein
MSSRRSVTKEITQLDQRNMRAGRGVREGREESRICRDMADVLKGLPYAPGGTRTPNLLIRSQMLYPIELRALGLQHTTGLMARPYRSRRGQIGKRSSSERYKTRTCDLHDVNVAL